jgi:two-component system response regulator HydG
MNARILIADDKENITKLFRRILPPGYEVLTAEDGTHALALAAAGDLDVIVTDLRMPGADGLTVLREAKRFQPDVEVILMTGFGTVQTAVTAMKEGAFDYLSKPFDPDEAVLLVERALERKRLREQARDLRRALEGAYKFENLVGKSQPMQKVLELLQRAAASPATVLITGESGTGKEVVARAIHFSSPRKTRRFVGVNCGAIPDALVESELFGHVRGAFTGAVSDKRGLFEEADGGTIFLDEIGELPLLLQVKLNRALQERTIRRVGGTDERKVDVRVIAATHGNLAAAVAAGKFRDDLYYRLNIFPIHLPPLRERRDDIPALVAHLIERHAPRPEGRVEGFTPEALSALVRYDWPGNVRELENAIERALAVTDAPRIPLEALPDAVAAAGRPRATTADELGLTFREAVDLARDRASREYLVALMRENAGNVTQAAERAGVERETLHRLLKRHGVRSDAFKP